MAQSSASERRLRHERILPDDRHNSLGAQDLRLASELLQATRQDQGPFDTKLANYVFSRKPPKRPAPSVEFVTEPVKTFAQRLRATPGKQIWMTGGAGLIASFLDAGEMPVKEIVEDHHALVQADRVDLAAGAFGPPFIDRRL
jgi:hypothetical protein